MPASMIIQYVIVAIVFVAVIGYMLYKVFRQDKNAGTGCPSCCSGCKKCSSYRRTVAIDKSRMRPVRNGD